MLRRMWRYVALTQLFLSIISRSFLFEERNSLDKTLPFCTSNGIVKNKILSSVAVFTQVIYGSTYNLVLQIT